MEAAESALAAAVTPRRAHRRGSPELAGHGSMSHNTHTRSALMVAGVGTSHPRPAKQPKLGTAGSWSPESRVPTRQASSTMIRVGRCTIVAVFSQAQRLQTRMLPANCYAPSQLLSLSLVGSCVSPTSTEHRLLYRSNPHSHRWERTQTTQPTARRGRL
jgi:hypothetical protein